MDESVVNAIAARPGRSTTKRPTNSAITEEQKFASRSQAIANQKGGLDNLATAVAGDF
jgi:hypothetical protein